MKKYEAKYKIKVELETKITETFSELQIIDDYESLQELKDILFDEKNKEIIEREIKDDLSWLGNFNKVNVTISEKELNEIEI